MGHLVGAGIEGGHEHRQVGAPVPSGRPGVNPRDFRNGTRFGDRTERADLLFGFTEVYVGVRNRVPGAQQQRGNGNPPPPSAPWSWFRTRHGVQIAEATEVRSGMLQHIISIRARMPTTCAHARPSHRHPSATVGPSAGRRYRALSMATGPGGEGILPSLAPTGAHGLIRLRTNAPAAHTRARCPRPQGAVAGCGQRLSVREPGMPSRRCRHQPRSRIAPRGGGPVSAARSRLCSRGRGWTSSLCRCPSGRRG